MFDIVLYHPEIPPNTGNIIRLAANVGAQLHLVHPLGFSLDDRRLRRAGLDYHELAVVHEYPDFAACTARLGPRRLFMLSTRGEVVYDTIRYVGGDVLVFGSETRGLPRTLREAVPRQRRLRIPLRPDNRSLNLSNAVAVVIYEAWRQQGFAGAQTRQPLLDAVQPEDDSSSIKLRSR